MSESKIDPLDPGEESDAKAAAAPSAAGTGQASTPGGKPRKKKRTWKRRLWLAFLIVLGIGVLLRIAVQVAFPIVLARVADGYGLKADYEKLRMSMLSGDVGIGRIEFQSQKTGERFASANYVRATISPLKLLIGKLEVWRVEADGVDLHLSREADGTIPVLGEMLAAPANDNGQKKAETVAAGPKPIDLTSPAHIEGFRLQHLRLHLVDKTLSPPVDAMVQLDIRVDDIGSPTRPARFYLNLYSDPVLDALTIEGQGRAAGAVVDAEVRMNLKGLHLRPLAQYLEPVGIRPVAYDISAHAAGTLKTTPAALVTAVSQVAAATRPGSRPASAMSRPAEPGFPVDAKPAEFVGGTLKLKKLNLLADGIEAAACDLFEIDLTRAHLSTAHLSRVLIDGVRANATKNAEGNLVIAGLELVPVFPATRPSVTGNSAAEAPVSSASAPTGPAPSAPAFRAALDELLVRNVRIALEDRSVTPVTPVAFEVETLTIRDIVLDPDRPDVRMKIAGAFKSPGVARSVRLDGDATPFAQNKTLNLTFDVGGIEPSILKPYLDFAGLESRLKDGSFKANLNAQASIDAAGVIGVEARLGDISFRDGQELFGMKDVRFSEISVDPRTGVLRVGAIDISGPALAFKREKDGALSGFGFRTKTPSPRPDRPTPPSQPGGIRLAKFELARLTWKDVAVRFDDDAAVPPASVAIGDAGLEIKDFSFDLEDLEPATRPGQINGWLVAPNIAEKLTMTGTLTSTTSTLVADLQFSGQGITAAGLSGYLQTLGIEPLLKDGSFLAHVRTTLGKTDQGLKAALLIDDVVYADGETELAGVDRVKLDQIELSPTTLSLGIVEIVRPRASMTLEEASSVIAGGVRVRRIAKTPAAAGTAVPTAVPTRASDAKTPPPLAAAAAADAPMAEPFAVVIGGLKLTDAALQFTDQSSAKPVNTTARLQVEMGSLTLGRDGPPADLKLMLKADNIVDRVAVEGKVLANPDTQAVTLKVDVAGLRGTALAGYLPTGTAFNLKDGRLITSIDAGVDQLPAGGIKARLLVNGLDYRDGQTGPVLLKLDQFRVTAQEINADGGVVTIDEVVLGGFEMDAVRGIDGSIGVMGLSLGVPSSGDGQAAPAVAAATDAVQASRPVELSVATTLPAAVPADASTIVARARKAPPLVSVNVLDLNVRRIGYTDLSAPETQPLNIADLRLRLLEKLTLLGKDPAGQSPMKLELTGRVDPLIGGINLQLQAAPFAQQPSLNADLVLSGIRGEGIFSVAPKLRESIDASDLLAGEFRFRLEATAKVDRRGPMDVDFSKGFDLEAMVRNIEFRSKQGGDILLGLEEVRIEEAKVRPVKDDAGRPIASSVRIKSIDLTKPMGQIVRDAEGIRAAGLLMKLPTPGTPPTTAPSESSALTQAPASTTQIAARPPTTEDSAGLPGTRPAVAVKPAAELRVDKFTISGIDFRVIDRSVDPVFVLPLTSLDVDVRDLSNLSLYEENRPVRFSANLNAGKVTVPKKLKGGLIGAVGDVATLLGGAGKPAEPAGPPELEDRELFSQIAAAGKIALFPHPDGYAKVNVSGFEMAAVGGYAKQAGIDLTYGTFDMPLDLRGDGKGGFVVDTRPAITDLSVSEPANGPIFRYLALPGPLDVAIGALESADKSITIPVRGVTLTPDPTGKYSVGGIGQQIAPAISSVFVTAIASIPAKAVTGLTGAVGLDALFATQEKPETPIVLSFPSGYTGLETAELAKLRSLAERMRTEPELTLSVKHELGAGDLAIAELRANPASADAQAMAYALRQRKIELTQLRADVAAATRTRLAVGAGVEVDDAVSRLRAIDQELSRTEDAMDRTYEFLRPGAERQGARRTRAAALDLGQERLNATRQVLVEAGISDLVDRVKPSKPNLTPGPGVEGGTITITLVKVKK